MTDYRVSLPIIVFGAEDPEDAVDFFRKQVEITSDLRWYYKVVNQETGEVTSVLAGRGTSQIVSQRQGDKNVD